MKQNNFYQEYFYKEDLWFINTSSKGLLLNVELTGITYPDPTYYITRKNVWDFYVIEYVKSGKGYIKCGGQKYTVKAGDAYIIRNYTNHEYYADPQDPYEKIWINISGALLDHILTAFNFTEPVTVRSVDISAHLEQLNKILSDGYDLKALSAVLLNMIFDFSDGTGPKDTKTLSLAENIQLHIDKNINTSISASDVAEHFRITPIYANRVFKSRYGQTIKQYINEAALKKAAQLLKNSDFSIGDISDMLGFCNDNYFANQFKKYYGISPKQYQLQHRKKRVCNTPNVSDKK